MVECGKRHERFAPNDHPNMTPFPSQAREKVERRETLGGGQWGNLQFNDETVITST
jgi:hypothetical protein